MAGPTEADLGLVGLGVMAGAYARNLYFRGFNVSVWTLNEKEVETFNEDLERDKKNNPSATLGTITCHTKIREFMHSLGKPKKILMLIPAGNPVDSMLNRLLPMLKPDDMLVDGGNEWYKTTDMRILRCTEAKVRYAGMGISGGEMGARTQPCLMFGGNKQDYEKLKPLLSQDGKDFYVGPDSSGHYVKMVHNGVEYALMQTICEMYKLMKLANGLTNSQVADVFKDWDKDAQSYLLRITQMILNEKEGDEYLVDKITPVVESNGTGKWTVQDSFDRGVPVPTIGMSVDMRSFSNLSQDFVKSSAVNGDKTPKYGKFDLEDLKQAFECTAVAAFSQGMHLLAKASTDFMWELSLSNVADIWSRNSIISCKLLNEMAESYKKNDKLLLMHPSFRERVAKGMEAWKRVCKNALEYELPVPAVMTSLQYAEVLFAENHCHNLLQAQRDCFGSHSFERVDKPGKHHHNWWKSVK